MINEDAGLISSDEVSPYFDNIDSENQYFSAIQTATEFGILSTDISVDPDATLNRQWLAYTMVHLADMTLTTYDVKDCAETMFSDEIQTAVSSGIMEIDDDGYFYPEKIVEKEEAVSVLEKVIQYLDYSDFESKEEIIFSDELNPIKVDPLRFDKNSLIVTLSTNSSIVSGDFITWFDEDGKQQVYEVKDTHLDGINLIAELSEIDLYEYAEQIDLEGESELDFSKVEIIEEGDETSSSDDSQNSYFKNMSSNSLKKTKTINGYSVTYQVTSSGIQAEVSKILDHNEKLYASCKLNGIKVKYKWFSKKDDVENSYFQIQANTIETLGISKSNYEKMYGDFSELSATDFVNSLQNFLKPKSQISEVEIPICTLRIPIESSNTITVKAKLSLVLYATGEAKLTLTQKHVLGMEIRDGHARVIREFTHDQNASMKAETGMTADTKFSLNFLNRDLMDIGVSAGAKALINTTLHLYDDSGSETAVTSAYPIDAVNDLASVNHNVLVCGDMNAYWILKLKINSSQTLLGKLGFSKNVDVLNSNNAPLFPGAKKHIENWNFVEKCTRSNRSSIVYKNDIESTNHITLDSYHISVSVGGRSQIKVKNLPSSYHESDLVYSINDDSIATVSNHGTVIGKNEGSTEITIRTTDQKLSVTCSVIVLED